MAVAVQVAAVDREAPAVVAVLVAAVDREAPEVVAARAVLVVAVELAAVCPR